MKPGSTYTLQDGETDDSFGNNLAAVLKKRLNIYKRNKKVIFNDMIMPALIMLLGVLLSKVPMIYRSESRIQAPDRLPLPQRVLLNRAPVN